MINIVLVDKGGTIKTVKIKDNSRNNLYKKCGIRSDKDFKCHTKWNVTLSGEKHRIELWGRTEGKANTENKYDFPPPMDNSLFFGTCCLIKVDLNTDLLVNLTQELWEKIYEKLFGGFEDLNETGEDDENEEDELDNISPSKKTKTGYLKDGFVVDESESESDYDTDNEDVYEQTYIHSDDED